MKKLALILVAAIGCLPPLSFAQAPDLPVDDRGLKPFGSYAGGNLDSINMANGSLTLHIPFWSYPQRGDKLRLNYFINFTSNPWKTTEFCGPNACHERWQWLGPCGTQACMEGGIGIKTDQGAGFSSEIIKYKVGNIGYSYTSWSAHQPSGAIVHLAETTTRGDFRSFDGSGLLFRPSSPGVWDRDGTYGLTDPNGNYRSSLTDTLGRAIPAEVSTTDPNDLAQCDNSPLPTTSATIWNLPAPNDGTTSTAKLILCRVTIHLHKDAIDPGNGDLVFDADKPFIQNIVLPNGTKWKFEYQANEGNVTKITLPTGGSISYSWTTLQSQCEWPYTISLASRTLNAGDGTLARTWTYQWLPLVFTRLLLRPLILQATTPHIRSETVPMKPSARSFKDRAPLARCFKLCKRNTRVL